jgi:hypothetical protein
MQPRARVTTVPSEVGDRMRPLPLLILAVILALLVAAAAMAFPTGARAETAADCGYSSCHGGAPAPGTDAAPAAAPVPTTIGLKAKVKARRQVVLSGSVEPTQTYAQTVRVKLSRKVGKRYKVWRTLTTTVAAGSSAYSAKVRLARGSWRAVATCADATTGKTVASPTRAFVVR